MLKKKIHFGWFAGTFHGPIGWDEHYAPAGYDWRQPEVHQQMASICEKGMFDVAIYADTMGIPSTYQGSINTYVKYGLDGICHDPSMLAGMIAAETKHIGIATTVSTSLVPPYILARQVATLDHLSKGRIAWNVVTTGNEAGFFNLGYDGFLDHDARYDKADEYMDLCFQLWGSWDPDAVVMDKKTGIFADPNKVHPINFEGQHYKSRGPLNVVPSPQGRPTIIQAGASDRGKEFASRWADAVICGRGSVDAMKAYYDDVKGRMIKYGRNPDELKIFFLIKPTVGETEEIAKLKTKAHHRPVEAVVQAGLAALSYRMNFDLSQFNPDEPLPEMDENSVQGGKGTLSQFYAKGPDGRSKTLKEIAYEEKSGGRLNIIGNPEQVADRLQDIMEAVGGDGYAITSDCHNHAYMLEFVNTVIPILQERDLVRKEYTGKTLREHLREF